MLLNWATAGGKLINTILCSFSAEQAEDFKQRIRAYADT